MTKLTEAQLHLAQQIRTGVTQSNNKDEQRRVEIYQELFFNNLEDFCATTFPVLKSTMGTKKWLALVRSFFIEHQCETPHFIEISEEFLTYLAQSPGTLDEPWMLELAHYEWVELASATAMGDSGEDVVSDREAVVAEFDQELVAVGQFSQYLVSIPESTWPLAYNYPVHTISADNKPLEPTPTYIVVYRDPSYEIQFVGTDALTVHLMTFIQQHNQVSFTQCIDFLTSDAIQLEQGGAQQFVQQMFAEFNQRRAITLTLQI
ncbi:putative DNA-binding domain-containing protein [Psychrosphaera sp. B3R10]|nr:MULTISPECIES: putative DNA-binding domain-containing protein [unclassified Psychrosphaera]MBU2883943.1 putative DNA-binding domain-containing protein [Psychrosphaera sp. I2R16]MBU2990348.1 putative DNA-binding domain-containing protein [Psychrosphaera sp. B3R10]